MSLYAAPPTPAALSCTLEMLHGPAVPLPLYVQYMHIAELRVLRVYLYVSLSQQFFLALRGQRYTAAAYITMNCIRALVLCEQEPIGVTDREINLVSAFSQCTFEPDWLRLVSNFDFKV